MYDISLHLLDIVENATRAGATRVSIVIEASTIRNLLSIAVTDNGAGMDEEQLRQCNDPFFTTKASKKWGLGVSLFKQSALEAGGSLCIESKKGRGTTVRATFGLNHIDRRPIGDIASTLTTLIAGSPEVEFLLICRKDGASFEFDTCEIRRELGDIPITDPNVLKTLRAHIDKGIASVGLR